MYCPNCKTEYKKGIIKCKDCGETLVEKLEVELEELTAMNAVKIVSVDNTVNANLVLNLLRNNEIPCYAKDNGIGSYMNIYMGYSIFGKEIYVDKSDYEHAIEVLKVIEPKEEDTITNNDNNLEEEKFNIISLQNTVRRKSLTAKIILFINAACILLATILNSLVS